MHVQKLENFVMNGIIVNLVFNLNSVLLNGIENCNNIIKAHKKCMKQYGYDI